MLFTQQQQWVEKFARLAPGIPLVKVPRSVGAMHDIRALRELGRGLVE